MANAVVNIKELKFRRLILDTHTPHTHSPAISTAGIKAFLKIIGIISFVRPNLQRYN